MPEKIVHKWLRDALADKGLRQKDLAKLWGVTEPIASRFIQNGEPRLTWDRAVALADTLDMDMNTLRRRMALASPRSEQAPNKVEQVLEEW